MRSKNKAKHTSIGIKTLSLALASSCLIYSGAYAAGLGKLTVLSALGQPLRAEIELTSVNKDDAEGLLPKVASFDTFRQANVDYSASLSSLRFAVVDRGSRHFVLITSTQSINEPFLELLLELNSSSGKLIREYTLLLDPVELQANKAASSAGKSADVGSATTPITPLESTSPSIAPITSGASKAAEKSTSKIATASAEDKPTRQAIPVAKRGESRPEPQGEHYYQVKSGDTLRKIASQMKHPGVSLEQMLVALQRNNSRAFINNNMNLIRSGSILAIPDVNAAESTNRVEAHNIVLAQSVDFSAYRHKLANQIAQANPEKSAETKKTDSGKITAKVIETPTPANESKDKLKLSKAQLQDQANGKAVEEDRIAQQRALESVNARVKELEQNAAKLQKLLELQNKSPSAAPPAPTTAPAVVAPVVEKNVQAEAPATTPNGVKAAAAASSPALATATPASVVASSPTQQANPATPKKLVVVTPEPKASFLDDWMQYLPYGAGLLALLGGLGIYINRRRKKTEPFDDESILTGSSMKTNSMFGSTGGQSVDTNNSVFNSNFAPSASQLDANEVDPVAEADVYIAYGRDEQAEEILKEALRTQPDRQTVRVKLLEIYAHRKDVRTFEVFAGELYGMTGGEGADWAQAASLGAIIDPENPLYAGGHGGDKAAVLGAATLPIESLDPEVLLGKSMSQQMLDAAESMNSTSAQQDTNHSLLLVDEKDLTAGVNNFDDTLDFDLGLTTIAAINPDEELLSPFEQVGVESNVSLPLAELESAEKAKEVSADVIESKVKATPADAEVTPLAEVKANNDEVGLDFAALDFDIPESMKEDSAKPVMGTESTEAARVSEKPTSTMMDQDHSNTTSFEFDLTGIDFELPKMATEVSAQKSIEAPIDALTKANAADNSIDELEMRSENALETTGVDAIQFEEGKTSAALESESSAEMATKLDLAIAYQEIGDKDGARELLEEVLKGGSPEQIARAKTLLFELA